MNDSAPLILQALRHQSCKRPPVWLMRQAGRYMKAYRDLKSKHGFLGLCRSPELAAEVTMQPVRAFDPDAAIIFSDIMIPLEGMGIEFTFNPGPQIENKIKTLSDVNELKVSDPLNSCPFVFEAISSVKRQLSELEAREPKALIGFAGAPWTLACYIVEQDIYKHFQGTQVFAHKNPEVAITLLTKITDVIVKYVLAQVEAGAEVIQIFDSWGGILGEEDYKQFSLPFLQRIFEQVRSTGCSSILYVNNSAHLLSALEQSGADCISVDWRTPLDKAENTLSGNLALQGNLDPTHLFKNKEDLHQLTRKMLSGLNRKTGYIANLGHGILPHTPIESVQCFIDAVKEGW